ncbi:allophanate hydrolase subunit 1 [Kitasatospora sp. NPDC017646]|uniref:allophanate hydrolase subunit 1 n=1 Tax=Kitasatospora sp. NPDC017646 TaxID=3364024 RepID=UPI003789BCFD
MNIRVLRVGLDALLVELDDADETIAFHAELQRRRATSRIPAVAEVVPAERTVLLDGVADPEALAADLAGWRVPPLRATNEATVTVPVRYDGADVAEVATLWGVAEEEVARIHSATEFRVAFSGFAPGFGYLTGLPERYRVPRRAVPRPAVPAGAIAIAGPYTGVYPRSSPGGWQLIGHTDAVLWDPSREPAALFSPGTRVRFVIAEA